INACSPQEENTLLEANEQYSHVEKAKGEEEECFTESITTELVVQYNGRAIYQKEKIRDRYKVLRVKKCECADETLELWVFGATDEEGQPIDIEEKKQIAETDPDLEGMETNFRVNTTGTMNYYSGGTPLSGMLSTHLISGNQNAVDIAVLDTGLQFDYSGLQPPFLYHDPNNTLCNDNGAVEISGWDFINQDPVAEDQNGHGTIVTGIIAQKLESLAVNYRILPVKIFNKNGQGTYFNLLCGYQFAVNKPGIDIVNMSFGWCGKPYTLLQKFIDETEDKGEILLVSSAGNKGWNNDEIGHYPSSYSNMNILSIAAMNSPVTNLATYSNFGSSTVDYGAQGTHTLPIFGAVSGSSFAAASATAKAAFFYDQGIPMPQIETHIKAGSIHLNSLQEIRTSSYISD
ncbi:MAG: S8 family serine peptidase, partial [Planctomycetota bacterium]